MSVKEAFAIPLILLNSADGLRPQNPPPSHGMGARKKVTHVGGANGGGVLPPESYLVDIRELHPCMRETGAYGEQREAAIVLLAAEPLLRGCEQDLAIPGDCRSRIVGSVVDSECQHFLLPILQS
jgi:hypothetical protein